VNFWYLPEKYLGSDDSIQSAIIQQQYFLFSLYRGESNSTMADFLHEEGATEKDLIDGKYFFREPHSLYWTLDKKLMYMCIPASPEVIRGDISVVEYLGLSSVADLAKFAETTVVDLR